MSCLKCLLLFLPVYLKKSLDVFPGSTHCLWCLSGLSSVSANVFLVSSVDVFPKCLPMSFAKSVYRSHLMSSRINPQSFFQYLSNGLMCSVWAGSQLCLSANVFLMRILLMSVWTELCVCQCLSSELSRCLPLSVSQCLSPNLSKEPLDVFLDQPNVCLMGLIGVLTELALTCLSASVYGENPADVCLDWIHLFSCQCLWRWIQSMSA